MRRVGMLLLACLLIWGCSLGRSPTSGPWLNPPLAEQPKLDYQSGSKNSTGRWLFPPDVIVVSSQDEAAIQGIGAVFTKQAWAEFSAWVAQTYEDGKVRWRVLEEANRR